MIHGGNIDQMSQYFEMNPTQKFKGYFVNLETNIPYWPFYTVRKDIKEPFPSVSIRTILRKEFGGKWYLILIKQMYAIGDLKKEEQYHREAIEQMAGTVYKASILYKLPHPGVDAIDQFQIAEEQRIEFICGKV